jgi:hypothetical protein
MNPVYAQTQRESPTANLRRITRAGYRACGTRGIGSKRAATETLGRVFEAGEWVVGGEAEGPPGGDGMSGEAVVELVRRGWSCW